MTQNKQSQMAGNCFAKTMPVLDFKANGSGRERILRNNVLSNQFIRMVVADHAQCLALSGILRGKLCDQLAGNRPAQLVPLGKCLYLAGEPAKSIYCVRNGLLKTSIVSEDGREVILRLHKPRDIFGELCFCGDRRREQAMAMEDSEVVQIPAEDVILHLQKNRQALSDFMALMSQFLADSHERLLIFFSRTPMERLIQTLLKLAAELGEPVRDGVEMTHYIKQEELAAMICAPRQVVSSLLNQLRELRLVRYARKRSLTINKEALRLYLRSITGK